MKIKIKQVQQYFKNKILNGEFEIVEQLEHRLLILIDGEYHFCIWTGNQNIPDSRALYESGFNFVWFTFTQKERFKLHGQLYKIVKKYKTETLLKQKEDELLKLREELKS